MSMYNTRTFHQPQPRDFFRFLPAFAGVSSASGAGGGRLGVYACPLGCTPFAFGVALGVEGAGRAPFRCGGTLFGLRTPLTWGMVLGGGAIGVVQ